MKNWSIWLLCIWLIVTGLIILIGLEFNGMDVVIPILGIAAGVLLILSGKSLSDLHPVALLLLAVWLIARGAVVIFDLSFNNIELIIAILAIVALPCF